MCDLNWWGVVVLVVFVIVCEGSEMVIFLYGFGFGQLGYVDGSQMFVVVIGFGFVFFMFYLLQFGGKYFLWWYFFCVIEVMLLFFGVGLFQIGVDKLIDKEILLFGILQVWDMFVIFDDLGMFGLFVVMLIGYCVYLVLINLVVYVVYWVVVWLLMKCVSCCLVVVVGCVV